VGVIYRALAWGAASVHVLYVLFVVLGSVLVLRWPFLLWVHVVAVLWAVATMTTDLGCALTSWEKSLWRRGGQEPYPEGFVQHYVLRMETSNEDTHRYHVALGVGVLALNVVVYAFTVFRR
jgi:uncharacterized membrane protein